MLAECYKDGEGCNSNPKEAFYWMKEAADIGCVPFAISELANYSYLGFGVEKIYEKTVEYLEKIVDVDLSCNASAQIIWLFVILKAKGLQRMTKSQNIILCLLSIVVVKAIIIKILL